MIAPPPPPHSIVVNVGIGLVHALFLDIIILFRDAVNTQSPFTHYYSQV